MLLSPRLRTTLRAAGLLCFMLSFAIFGNGMLFAQTTITVSGTVSAAGDPVAGATVTTTVQERSVATTTDARGQFSFPGLAPGTYELRAASNGRTGTATAVAGAAGASVRIAIESLQLIGRTSGAAAAVAARRSGTDVTLNSQELSRSASSGNLSETLLQVPGAARGANGVVHINGDHGDVNYVVDGVSLPQELNRVIGSEVDPNNINNVAVLEGAYPAQYGEKFGAVVDIGTKIGAGPPGMTFQSAGGSYGRYDSTFGYHTPIGASGSVVVALRGEQDGRALDPPSPGSPHDRGSNTNEFVRVSLPRGGDIVNVSFTHSLQTFQIPPDIANGAPGNTNDNETQNDYFASIQYQHPIGNHGAISFGPSIKRSTIVDSPDFTNDIAYGIAAGGTADCSQSFVDSTVAGCANSVFANRSSTDYRFNADYALSSPHHEIRAGTVYDLTLVSKRYAITLQPNNPYGAAPFTVLDTAPNTGHTQEAYVEDSWKMGATYQLDYGLRYDTFGLFSSQFQSGASAFSPRIKLTRFFGSRASAYLYYGRFFTPYSFENVSPAAASLILPQSGNFDLRPQRDSDYELGFRLPVGAGQLGFRFMQKNATDVIDDTQVGFTNLHQDINYAQGRIATQSAYYQHPLARGGRVYASASHTYSVVRGCETQLLAPCFNATSQDWVPADHDQRIDLSAGLLTNDQRGGWFAFDGEYGSGLTSSYCQPLTNNCKVPPHITFDTEKGFGFAGGAITLRIRNILNDTYRVTYLNAQGNHYARPRSVELGFRLGAH